MEEPKLYTGYDPVVKTLHWAIGLTWITVWTIGILGVHFRDAFNADDALTIAHKALGSAILVLVLLRLVWHFVATPRKLVPTMPDDIQRAGDAGHRLLYAVAIFTLPVTGWLLSSIAGEPSKLLWTFTLPSLLAPTPAYFNVADWVHAGLAWLMGLLVITHIIMALKHFFVDRDKTLQRMLPGATS